MADSIYYKVESGPAHDFCMDWRQRKSDTGKRLLAWAEQHGGKGFVPGHGSSRIINGSAIHSLIFEGKPADPIWRESRHRTADGLIQWRPHQGTKVGRALAKEMASLESLPSPDEFCDHFGFPHGISYSGGDCIAGSETTAQFSITTAKIGWIGDQFWVVLPDLNARLAEHRSKGRTTETPDWLAPLGMLPLTKDYYDLAIAQDKVRKLEAVA